MDLEEQIRAENLNYRLATLVYARKQLGVTETSENWGEEVADYLDAVGIHEPAPWCAAFVNDCAEDVAVFFDIRSPLEDVPLQGYVQSYYEYAEEHGWLIPPEEVKPGDLFMLYFPRLGRWAHIGFVDGVIREGKFKTVEGNSNDDGSREGKEVVSRFRSVDERVAFARWT